jgi:predicted nucleic acid-binding protein
VTALLDTSILIDQLRGVVGAKTLLANLIDEHDFVAASVVTRVEVFAGMRETQESSALELFAILEWIPVDEDLANRAGTLARRYFRSHSGIDPTDYIIAATAQRLDAQLYTMNVRHFPMFVDLQKPY